MSTNAKKWKDAYDNFRRVKNEILAEYGFQIWDSVKVTKDFVDDLDRIVYEGTLLTVTDLIMYGNNVTVVFKDHSPETQVDMHVFKKCVKKIGSLL